MIVRKLLPPVIAFSVALSGCSGGSPTTAGSSPATASAAPSGRDLYSGIVFGAGPAAELLAVGEPRLLDPSKEETSLTDNLLAAERLARSHGASPALVQQITAARTRIESGEDDPAELRAVLAQKIETQLDNIDATNPGYFDTFRADLTSGDHVRIEGALDHAASIAASLPAPGEASAAPGAGPDCVAVLAVAVAVVAVFYYKVKTVLPQDDSSPLQRDVFVDKLATNLRGA